ncbi:MAG: 1-(5-phosphoribosyl)-5-[(5-phosphoribosylamino)methylideneamino]imidazole-4-carboxamide isomerase [Acutalibacteraceae bacterium]|nr:1-(5-phosphoribosyl)-5-[(5-phosphoribosylamino)methylideneamino]imidazole-4-carboxamide isomerase [Acutalibacteraceae bacterium]
MIILPAIDIKDGECVRLQKGDYNTVEKVAENPYDTAQWFKNAGATWMHMVDLDGAKDGSVQNKDLILDVAKSSGLNVEVGGGIRNMQRVEMYLNGGINRVILGSAAVKNPDFVKEAVKEYGDKIAVGIDAMNGMVCAEGWIDQSEIEYIELAKRMEDIGVKYIIFTDISKDGMLSGPNLTQLDALQQAVSCNIIASGGISCLKDILNVSALKLYGTITGRAIYTGDLDLKAAVKASSLSDEIVNREIANGF